MTAMRSSSGDDISIDNEFIMSASSNEDESLDVEEVDVVPNADGENVDGEHDGEEAQQQQHESGSDGVPHVGKDEEEDGGSAQNSNDSSQAMSSAGDYPNGGDLDGMTGQQQEQAPFDPSNVVTSPTDAIVEVTSNTTLLPGDNSTIAAKASTHNTLVEDIPLYLLAALGVLMLLQCCRTKIPETHRGDQIRERARRNLQRRRQRLERRQERARLKKDTPEQRKVWMEVNMHHTTIKHQEPNGYFYWMADKELADGEVSLNKKRKPPLTSTEKLLLFDDDDRSHNSSSSSLEADDDDDVEKGNTANDDEEDNQPATIPLLPSDHPAAEEEESTCIICLEDFQKNDAVAWSFQNHCSSASDETACRHVFHVDCIQLWLCDRRQDDCPACRTKILVKNPYEKDSVKKRLSDLVEVGSSDEQDEVVADDDGAAAATTSDNGADGNDDNNDNNSTVQKSPLDVSADTAETLPIDDGSSDGEDSTESSTEKEDIFFIMGGLLTRKSCPMGPPPPAAKQKPTRRSSILQTALNALPMPSIPLRRVVSQGASQFSQYSQVATTNTPPRPIHRRRRASSISNSSPRPSKNMMMDTSLQRLQHLVSPPTISRRQLVPTALPPMPIQNQESFDNDPIDDLPSSLTTSIFSALSKPLSIRRTQSDGIQAYERANNNEEDGIMMTTQVLHPEFSLYHHSNENNEIV
eukprot:CAMPEP_0119549068 /NCGR_PEP_ID=MMETSP1352-20130426/2852_1 /TAXON_ID=265584 /ORGANISM="Stauroneis constricta, Strain CCMP1120" /LENGTH=693 /DNA_ID=CAMNT_0007594517 /DNA_START=516 /DNA_END=2597 /DNA_ORIENTATION=-